MNILIEKSAYTEALGALYPNALQSELQKAADQQHLYAVRSDETLAGAFVLSSETDDLLSRIEWQYGVKPVFLHSAAVPPELAGEVLAFACEEALAQGFDSLRTEAFGEALCAAPKANSVRLAGKTESGVCYEMPLTANCPMLPIRMLPAYRHGEMTPWGGSQLKTLYGRDIPDERTGEALEISAIANLESRTPQGETLPQLLARDAQRAAGSYANQEFPLLLKLLAAKQSLSVQVHPDDAYARANENGKLGKTEAWVILDADEGACLLYGIKDGVTIEDLRKGLESGEDIEPLIARVPVKPGEVYYMPAGMVHAIGAGILLYEIQQSSDVTYRLWDFNRTNAAGEKRPLHIRQSLDVIDPSLKGVQAVMPETNDNTVTTLLNVPAFRLDCASVGGECVIAREPEVFRMLTALSSLLLSWEGDAIALSAGDTVFLPAACPELTLKGVGKALLSIPPARDFIP